MEDLKLIVRDKINENRRGRWTSTTDTSWYQKENPYRKIRVTKNTFLGEGLVIDIIDK